MYDFGKLGKWSKKSLLENIKIREVWHSEYYYIESIEALCNKKKKSVNWFKKTFFMSIGDIRDYIKNMDYNDELNKDFRKYEETIAIIAREFYGNDKVKT